MSFPTDLLDDLYAAVDAGEIKIVRKILSKTSELLNHPHQSYVVESLLLKATNCKNQKVVEQIVEFLKTKAKVSFERYLGQAIVDRNLRSAKFFLQNGASFKKKEWLNNLASRYVFCKSDTDCRKDMLKLLVRFGLNTRHRNEKGENLLHIFVDHVDKDDDIAVDIAKILVNSGLSVNEVDGKGLTPLILSIKTQNIRLISFLIDSGADVNQKCGQFKLFPLYLAARYNNKDLVNLLLKNDADVNARGHNDWTPLHLACHFHNKKIINLLIQKGADTCAEDNDGKTPFLLLRDEIMYLMDV